MLDDFRAKVGVLILTWNEEANLARTLDALKGFPSVTVLDSMSTDATLEIAGRYRNVVVHQRAFDNHAQQWSYGLERCVNTEWVLALDADYVLEPELVEEIARLNPAQDVGGYRAHFRYCVSGRPLSGSLYPPVTVLYRRGAARYVQDGHTQRLRLELPVADLKARIRHDDRKGLARWLSSQLRYAELEADMLLATRARQVSWRDRVRRCIVLAPWLVPLHYLVARRGVLDGWHGVWYALERGIAEAVLSLVLVQRRVAARRGSKAASDANAQAPSP